MKNFLASFYYLAINFFALVFVYFSPEKKNGTKRKDFLFGGLVIRWCDFKPGEKLNWNWAKIMWNFFGFCRWGKKSSENDDRFSRMMRVLFSTRPEWKSRVERDDAQSRQKFFSAEWKTWKRKMLCMSWGIFFFEIKTFMALFFYVEKLFFLATRFTFLFREFFSAAQLMIRWTRAPLDTNSTVRSHCYSLLSVSLTATHNFDFGRRWISSRNYYTNGEKKSSNAIKKHSRNTFRGMKQ